MAPSADPSRILLSHPAFAGMEKETLLRDELGRNPDPAGAAHALIRYVERNGPPADRQQLVVILTVAGQSPFLFDLLLQNPGYLPWAAAELGRAEGRSPEDLREDLARLRFTLSSLGDAAALRRFKYREYLRIALRDYLGTSELAEPVAVTTFSARASASLPHTRGVAPRVTRTRSVKSPSVSGISLAQRIPIRAEERAMETSSAVISGSS